jgi:hypothetical protein
MKDWRESEWFKAWLQLAEGLEAKFIQERDRLARCDSPGAEEQSAREE